MKEKKKKIISKPEEEKEDAANDLEEIQVERRYHFDYSEPASF